MWREDIEIDRLKLYKSVFYAEQQGLATIIYERTIAGERGNFIAALSWVATPPLPHWNILNWDQVVVAVSTEVNRDSVLPLLSDVLNMWLHEIYIPRVYRELGRPIPRAFWNSSKEKPEIELEN